MFYSTLVKKRGVIISNICGRAECNELSCDKDVGCVSDDDCNVELET